MRWLDVGGSLVDFSKILFIMKSFDQEQKTFALKFHFSVSEYLETKFLDEKMAEDFYSRLSVILGNATSDVGTSAKDCERS